MRALLALILAGLLLAPSGASAQAIETEDAPAEGRPEVGGADAETDGAETDEVETDAVETDAVETDAVETLEVTGQAASAEGAATEDGGYEPDQRGARGPDGDYEPDQRGAEADGEADEAEPLRMEVAMGAASDADEYGTGRGLIGFDVQLWLGAGLVGLDTIDGANLVRPTQRGDFGASFGFVGALRLGPLSIGPRLGVTADPGFTMITLGGDVQAVLATGPLAPFLRASVSYVALAGLSDALPSQSEARVDGALVELGVGARFRLGGPFVVGAELSAGYLHLERAALPECTGSCTDDDFDLTTPGFGDGLTLRLHLFGGVSF